MNKPTLWGSVFILMSVISVIIFHTPHSKLKRGIKSAALNIESNNEEEREDGPARELRRDFIMTIDPSIQRVPSERLILAQQRIKELESHRITGTSNISWVERGPNNIGGRTRAILIDASDATGNTVWAGSVGGGLWKTTNFKSATPTWNYITGLAQNLAITCIAQDPSNSAIIYVGTGEGYNNIDAIKGLGIYKTTDGGATWNLIPSTSTGGINVYDFSYVQRLLVYTNGDLYAAASSAIYCNRGGRA